MLPRRRVHVPQPREHRLSARLQPLCPGREVDPAIGSDSRDAIALDDDGRMGTDSPGLGVEEARILEHQRPSPTRRGEIVCQTLMMLRQRLLARRPQIREDLLPP